MIRRETLVSVVLVSCVALVVVWEIAASRRSLHKFNLTAASFDRFTPASPEWTVRSLPASPDVMEPNIVAYELREQTVSRVSSSVLVRLVHGYNMPDCMRIKGYKVELLKDMRHSFSSQNSEGSEDKQPVRRDNVQETSPSVQVWRLTSSVGDVSIWTTAMISASDFSETDRDVRSMPFPRIGIPDDPRWLPRGITLRSLRHPIRNSRLALRSKWNSSRCDLATFLKLKQPAWVSDELITVVAASQHSATELSYEQEHMLVEQTVNACSFILGELKKWKAGNSLAVPKEMDKTKTE